MSQPIDYRKISWTAAILGGIGGLAIALTVQPTILGIPIRPDSLLNQPPADLPVLGRIAISFARGTVLVLHFVCFTLGSATVSAIGTTYLWSLRHDR